MTERIQELAPKLPGSQKVYEWSTRVLAQEIVGTVSIPYPFYVESAKGSRVVDVDGREYIDLTMGLGPLILGHSPDVAVEAAKQTADLSLHVGLPTPYQAELAELMIEAGPCAEKVVFCSSGTEATLYGMRVARAHTGKTKVGLFVGSYHGAHDYVLAQPDKKSDPRAPLTQPFGTGVPRETLDQVLLLPYRSEAAFDLIRAQKGELAVVLIEPVQSSNPRTDVGPFLNELRDVCTECGVLLLFDEVITGFRFGYGGGQEYFGVTPDLLTYGKIIGGGLPIGAVAGPAEIMDRFQFVARPDAVFAGGTFGGNPMSMRVGAAVLRHLRAHPEIYTRLSHESRRLADGVNGFLDAEGIGARLMQAESMFYLVFQKGGVESAWEVDEEAQWLAGAGFFARLHAHGVVVPGVHLFFLSAAHTSEDVDAVIEAFQKTFAEAREAGAR